MNKVIEGFDCFPRPLPSFNIHGNQQIPSFVGGLLSMALAMILTVYALTKLNILIARSAPIMASYIDRNAVPADEKLNFADGQLTFAFGIEGFIDGEFKDDPRYVKMFARLYGFDENG